ncbi:MAG: cell division protein ZapE [Steroidobacteraceae bacterium]
MELERPTFDALYRASIERHGYRSDAAQLAAVDRLSVLMHELETPRRSSWFDRLVGGGRAPAPRGVYLWGGVGRGKTFVMDLFHGSLGVPARREHFHRCMKDVHARLAALRDVPDPLERVADAYAGEARVLCLDELFVGDIADAMILAGLFAALDARGVALVFTSNSPPSALYRDGLQRARFLPAIALIERRCDVLNLDAGTDYRLRQLERAPLYLDAADPGTPGALLGRFESIAGDPGTAGGSLEVEGRTIPLLRSSAGVAWFGFTDLCDGPRGTADYVEIARDFHTVFVSGVPVFDAARDDEARRFIALVDEFYDRGVKLVLSAAAAPDDLYRGSRLGFDFERTRSRLAEMQSHAYLARPHRP